jgi:hypothetical protein
LFFVGLTILANRNKKNSKITGKKWLLKEIIFGYSSLTGLIYIPIQFAIRMDGENFNSWYLSVFSFLLVVLVLLEYIVLILIPYRADDFLKETYPEYEFVK